MAREIARKVRERNGVIAHVMEAEAVVAIGCCSKRNPLTNGESGNTDVCRLAAARRGNSKWVGIKTLRPNSHGHSHLKKAWTYTFGKGGENAVESISKVACSRSILTFKFKRIDSTSQGLETLRPTRIDFQRLS